VRCFWLDAPVYFCMVCELAEGNCYHNTRGLLDTAYFLTKGHQKCAVSDANAHFFALMFATSYNNYIIQYEQE
jgi:hypothetical protein